MINFIDTKGHGFFHIVASDRMHLTLAAGLVAALKVLSFFHLL